MTSPVSSSLPAGPAQPPTGGLSEAAARAVELTKVYGVGVTAVTALRSVSIAFAPSRFTGIMGPSGSGKSTLMHCMAGLDTVSSGQVFIGDTEINRLDERHLTLLRRDKIGFVFQQYNLLPTLTAAENITLPLDIAGRKPDPEWLRAVVSAVGLADRLHHRPTELSGGEQQRVACARALVARPSIIFADEPTGNLDSRSSAEVLGFLRRSVDDFHQTIVMVTHDPVAASYSDRVLFLADGHVVDEMARPSAERVLDRMKRFEVPASHVMTPAASGAPATAGPSASAAVAPGGGVSDPPPANPIEP